MPVVIPAHGLAFFDVPKTASTTVKVALRALDPRVDPDSHLARDRYIHELYPTHPIDPRRAFAATEGAWRFAVVRDPLRRLLSAYGNRVVHHRDQLRGRFPRLKARLLGLSIEPDLEAFALGLRRYRMQSFLIRHHTDLATRFLGTDLGRFDAVYPIEDLPLLEAELARRTGRPVVFGRSQTAGAKVTPAMLSRRAHAALMGYLAPEYRLLSRFYAPPPPPGRG